MTPMPHIYDCSVDPGWIDYNGHLRDAFYGLVFSHAVDALMDVIGLDAAHRAETGGTLYVVEDHRRYLSEVRAGAALRVETRVLGQDAKRVHLLQALTADRTGPAALSESLQLHVVQRPEPRVAPMPEAVAGRLALFAAPRSADCAGPISLRRSPSHA